MATEKVTEEKKDRPVKLEKKDRPQSHADGSGPEGRIESLQKTVGNRAVQRLLLQLKGEGGGEVDDELADRINGERSSGQSLDEGVAQSMGTALGTDFSGVRVHTTPEAADLSDQLSARAFTTGQDIFFGKGEYAPASSAGQELLAHELTHVVQQSSGAVGGTGKMTVNEPGDAFEQQADAVANADFSAQPGKGGSVQREGDESENEEPQAVQKIDDEEHLLLKTDEARVQRGAAPEEEEKLQTKPLDIAIQRVEQEDQEEKLLLKPDDGENIQRQELPEEKKEEEEA